MTWDTTPHTEQNDHAESTMPLYAGTSIVGEAGNFAINGRHNAMRWHEFSDGSALIAEPLDEYERRMEWTPSSAYTVETPQEPDDGDPDDDHVELADRESGADYISRVQAAEALYDQ